jgi:hypothetical protein
MKSRAAACLVRERSDDFIEPYPFLNRTTCQAIVEDSWASRASPMSP